MLNKANIFNEYPLWHIFTLWKANLKHYTEGFRLTRIDGSAVMSDFCSYVETDASKLLIYDPFNDAIVSGSDVSDMEIISIGASTQDERFLVKSEITIIPDSKPSDGVLIPMIFDQTLFNSFVTVLRDIVPIDDLQLNAILKKLPSYASNTLDLEFYRSSYVRAMISSFHSSSSVEGIGDKLRNAIYEIKSGNKPDINKVLNAETGKYLIPKGTSDLEEYIFNTNAGDIHITISFPKAGNKYVLKRILSELGGKVTNRTRPDENLKNRINVRNFNIIPAENMLSRIENLSKNDIIKRVRSEKESNISLSNSLLPTKTTTVLDDIEDRVSIEDEYDEV